jgi:hypothetical protein
MAAWLIRCRWSPTLSNFQLEKFEMPSGKLVVPAFPETAGAGGFSPGNWAAGAWAEVADAQRHWRHASRKT